MVEKKHFVGERFQRKGTAQKRGTVLIKYSTSFVHHEIETHPYFINKIDFPEFVSIQT